MNRFLKLVLDAKEIKSNREWRIFRKEFTKLKVSLSKSSPSFQDLWDIADFIKSLEYVFFYNNSDKSNFTSSINDFKLDGTNGFIIKNQNEYIIKITLYLKDELIVVDVNRLNTNNKTTIKFKNGEWITTKDEYSEALLNNIIKIIWNKLIDLLNEYVLY